VKISRVINAGGIPPKNPVLNQIYANVLERPVLVPKKSVTSLGSAIFAFLAAGTFKTLDEAQDKLCPEHAVFPPQPDAQKTYAQLYERWRKLYFALGDPKAGALGEVLPSLIKLSRAEN
jgi:L-ribulokinase